MCVFVCVHTGCVLVVFFALSVCMLVNLEKKNAASAL